MLLLVVACGEHSSFPAILLRADSLVNMAPDSALRLLLHWEDSLPAVSRDVRMYHRLLKLKATDKLYIPATTADSAIEMVRHYEKEESPRLAEAYYLMAGVYRDLEDAPQAISYYQKAAELLRGSDDYRLACVVHAQMGTLLLYQDVYAKALPHFREAYHCDALLKDSVGLVYDLRDMGRTYSTLGSPDSALYYYRAADRMARCIGNRELSRMVCGELAGYYVTLEKYREAYDCMNYAMEDVENTGIEVERASRYSVAARYYSAVRQWDSLAHYSSLLLSQFSTPLYRALGWKGLMEEARARGDYRQALEYDDFYHASLDSAQQIVRNETMCKADAFYNYRLREGENKRLLVEAFHLKASLLLLVLFIAVLVVSFFAYRQNRRRRAACKLERERYLKRLEESRYRESRSRLEENRKRIAGLEEELREAQASCDDLRRELIDARKVAVEKQNEQILAQRTVKQKAWQMFRASPICQAFMQATGCMKEEEWQELAAAIEDACPGFAERLNGLYPLQEREFRVSLLLKIGMPPGQIADVMARSKQAVSSIRSRLYRKVFGKRGLPQEWDRFVQEMV